MPSLLGTPQTTGAQVAINDATPGTLAFTVTNTGARRALVVFVSAYDDDGAAITGVTYNGTAMTLVQSSGTLGTTGYQAVYRLTEAGGLTIGSSQTISVAYTGGPMDELGIMASAWTDVNQTTPTDEAPADAYDTGTTDVLSATLGAGNVLIGGTYQYSAANVSHTHSDTTLTAGSGTSAASGHSSQYSTDDSLTFTYGISTSAISVGVELVHDAGSGGSPALAGRMSLLGVGN